MWVYRKTDFNQIKLLDYGCGNGRYLELFAEKLKKANLVGVEVSRIRAEQCRRKGFKCILISPEDITLPFEDEYFDIVFSSNVIEHIHCKNYLLILREIRRVLKPGGRFAVGTPNYPIKRLYDFLKAFKTKRFKYYFLDDPTHVNKLSIRQLRSDLLEVFDVVELEPTYILLEGKIKFLKNPFVRKKLEIFGDKIIGYCLKASPATSDK